MLEIGHYTFNCRFTKQAHLPEFKGSTLRGGFGHALKRIACALKRQDCETCLLYNTCSYAFLFEAQKARPDDTGVPRVAQRPHPYVIIPPDTKKRFYEVGSNFSFDFLLFGKANQYLPHVLFAVKEMGETGLGKRTECQGCFEVEQVLIDNRVIFSEDKLANDYPLPELSLEHVPPQMNDSIAITMQTPLRLKYCNELKSSLPFHLIVRAALRRISTLESFYGSGEPDLDYKGLVSLANAITIAQSDYRWVDIERYSNRQKSAMKFGGVSGHIVYTGDQLHNFWPLLKYCEKTHLGKQTSFGLGKIQVQSGDGG